MAPLILSNSRGNFADSFGDDFLGLRELGIAAEFGLSSLSIPKRLLKGKKTGAKDGPAVYVISSFVPYHSPHTTSSCS